MAKKKKKTASKPKKKSQFLSTGSTLLNLACTGKPNKGFRKGHYYFIVGDSSSGKTFLSLTCLSEAANNPAFKNYRFIHDNAEGGALMKISEFFGEAVAARLEAPGKNGESSASIEDFYYNMDDALKAGRPFIYILDSMDSLTSSTEGSKFEETKKADRSGKKAAGSYGDGKAKINAQNMRRLMTPLRKSESILIVISQTRDNIGFGFEKKTRSGGHALRFYASLEIWSSIYGQITKTVKKKKRQLGISCLCKVKKNRETGRIRDIKFPIYHSYGIDDIGGCVDFLVEENHWKKNDAGTIIAKEFDLKGNSEKLVHLIEDNSLQNDLRHLVASVWDEIEMACKVKRKKRYE